MLRVNTINAPPVAPPGVHVAPLRVDGTTLIDRSRLLQNCKAAMNAGYPILDHAGVRREEPVCIVGSGSSLANHLDELKRLKDAGAHIMAVKGAHDFLIGKGIIPDSAIAADAQQDRVHVFGMRQLSITYFLASQMHVDTWQYMRGYKVVIWHPVIDDGKLQQSLPEWRGVRRVYGGNTTGLRAISLQWILGRRNQFLFGFDSCLPAGSSSLTVDGRKVPAWDETFPVAFGGRWFRCNASLAQQCMDLMPTLQCCPGIIVTAIGDGALPWVLKCGKRAGWPV